jgi:hypothetical protein
MKRMIAVFAAVSLLALGFFPASVQSQEMQQVLQGTQIRLVLLNGLSSSVAREGDPFAAEVAEPVYLGHQLLLPAGTRVHGEVGPIVRPRRFSLFRGQAAMALYIRSIEFDRREVPAPMSILSIHATFQPGELKMRKDLKTEEGTIVHARRDVKTDLKAVGLSTSGGTILGAIFSHVMRGMVIGLVGSSAYVVARKGKEVELPARTGLLVRLEKTLTLPVLPSTTGSISGQP